MIFSPKSKAVFICLALLVNTNIAWSNEPETGILLSSLIEEALEKNPRIKQFQSSWQAVETVVPQVGAWMDPRVNVNIMNIPARTFDLSREPMTGKQVLVMQQIPFPGITGLKEDISEQSAFQAENYFKDIRNNVIYQLKTAYYSLFYIDKAVEITQKNKALIEDFVQIAESKYATGRGLQQDVLKAQVELSKLLERLIILRRMRTSFQAKINTLLDRDTETPIGRLAGVTRKAFDYSVEELQKMALSDRPMIQALDLGVLKAQLSHDLAKKDYWPSFNIGLGYSQREDRRDFISGMFSISLPIFAGRKQSKKVQQTRFEINAATERFNTVKNEIYFEVSDLYAKIEQNTELLPLFSDGIIPQASQSLQSAIAGYQVNKVDFLTLLDNQRTLFNYEIDYYRVLSEYRQQISRMEWIVGLELLASLQ